MLESSIPPNNLTMAPSRPLPKRVNPLLLPDEAPARKSLEMYKDKF